MNQTIVGQVREEVAGLKSALLEPGMPGIAEHIFSVEKAASLLPGLERPSNADERAAMRAELELLRNELRRLDDLSRSGQDFCRVFGANESYSPDGTFAETGALGSIVVRG